MISGKGQSENVSFNVMLYKISESRIKIKIYSFRFVVGSFSKFENVPPDLVLFT